LPDAREKPSKKGASQGAARANPTDQVCFFTQAVHQPFALTRLPANTPQGPSAAPALPV
jgi:hypothetical protein